MMNDSLFIFESNVTRGPDGSFVYSCSPTIARHANSDSRDDEGIVDEMRSKMIQFIPERENGDAAALQDAADGLRSLIKSRGKVLDGENPGWQTLTEIPTFTDLVTRGLSTILSWVTPVTHLPSSTSASTWAEILEAAKKDAGEMTIPIRVYVDQPRNASVRLGLGSRGPRPSGSAVDDFIKDLTLFGTHVGQRAQELFDGENVDLGLTFRRFAQSIAERGRRYRSTHPDFKHYHFRIEDISPCFPPADRAATGRTEGVWRTISGETQNSTKHPNAITNPNLRIISLDQ